VLLVIFQSCLGALAAMASLDFVGSSSEIAADHHQKSNSLIQGQMISQLSGVVSDLSVALSFESFPFPLRSWQHLTVLVSSKSYCRTSQIVFVPS